MSRRPIDDATKARRYDHILTLLQFENGDDIELNSCADFVQDVSMIVAGAYDDREPAWQEPDLQYADEPPTTVAVGDRVYWLDPAADHGDEDCSGPGTVVDVGTEPLDEDTIISIKKDDEGEVECFLHELRLLEDKS